MRASIELAPHLYWIQHIEDLEPGKEFSTPAMCGCHTLWVQETGSCRMRLAGRNHVLRPGQVFLADPGLAMTPSRGCGVIRAALDLAHRDAVVRSTVGRRVVPEADPQPTLDEIFGCAVPPLVGDPHATNLAHLLHSLQASWWRSEWDRLRAALSIGHWLLDYVQACSGEEPHPGYRLPGGNLAGHCDQLLDALFNKRVSIGDIAERLGVSQSHLTRTYHRTRGITPARRLAEIRLRAAMALLANGDLPIAAVAAEAGFGGIRTLHAHFRRQIGMAPGAWRKRHRRRPWAPGLPEGSISSSMIE